MRFSKLGVLFLASVSSAFVSLGIQSRPAAAAPSTVALAFTGGGTSSSTFTRGWEFSTSNPLSLTALGWWDAGGDGLADSHQVAIWNTAGTLLVSGTVASGTTEPLVSGFRFDSGLTGTTSLSAGTYIIGGLSTNNDIVSFDVPAANLTLAPGIAFLQNESNNAATFSFPNSPQAGLDDGIFGPSFQFAASSVPEPTCLAMVGVGGLMLAFRRRRA